MQEKENCKKVLTVFQDYLQTTTDIEVLWSEKKQICIFVKWYEDANTQIINSAEELCELMLNNIFYDVYLSHNLHKRENCDNWNLSEPAKLDFLDRVQPYMVQLPEYAYLINKLYTE